MNIIYVDTDLNPTGMGQTCPSKTDGPILLTDATYLECCHAIGHDGPHEFLVKWDGPA